MEELLRSSLPVRGAVVSPALGQAPRGAALRAALESRGVPLLQVGPRDFQSAADTESPQGVLAIAEIPTRTLDAIPPAQAARLLLLDGIQDPGNAGTLLRTAAAFGAITLALPGTVDFWNAKVVRSAMGALFHRPALSTTWEALDKFLGASGVELWGADSSGAVLTSLRAPARLALAVGNEGAGFSAEAGVRLARSVAIPVDPAMESLNVAVAAGILLHHFRP